MDEMSSRKSAITGTDSHGDLDLSDPSALSMGTLATMV